MDDVDGGVFFSLYLLFPGSSLGIPPLGQLAQAWLLPLEHKD